MFWRKKKIPKQAQILQAYLLGSMPLISSQLGNDAIKAGVRIFILGMADMLRQAEQLSWEQFVSICHEVFKAHKILPSTSTEVYLENIQQDVAKNEDLAKLMRVGAQSIQMFVVERDAQAPTDLVSVPLFVKKNESSFRGIAA